MPSAYATGKLQLFSFRGAGKYHHHWTALGFGIEEAAQILLNLVSKTVAIGLFCHLSNSPSGVLEELFRVAHKHKSLGHDLRFPAKRAVLTVQSEVNCHKTIFGERLALSHHAWADVTHTASINKNVPTGDALADLVPDAGHLRHMPTHIDVLCGHYHTVVERNSAAITADRKFLARSGPLNFYSAYRCHDYHFKAYGAMFLGQYRPAIEAAEEMVQTLPRELLMTGSPPMADWLEGFVPIKQHVLIRFGRWQDIIAQELPDDRELFCVTTAMMHYARTVALATTGDVSAAEAERMAFLAARDRVPESRMLFNNTCLDILRVAEAMLEGELEYRKGNHEAAFEHLRRSVEIDDSLPYDEPWGWMQPTRHALGALLMEQGRYQEAEAIYRSDLGLDGKLRRACQHPDNVWSLHGLFECLDRRGEKVEAALIAQRLDLASARADVVIKASCFCRLQQVA